MSRMESRRVERKVLEVELRGGLLLGGTSGAGFDDATLRGPDGLPYLPASALAGAIREQLFRLTDAETVERILGGPGNEPATEASRAAGTRPSSGEDPAGTLAPARELPGGGSTRVYFTDGVLDSAHTGSATGGDGRRYFASGRGFDARRQVSIDRGRRRASDGRLFHREVVAPFATVDRGTGSTDSPTGIRFRSQLELHGLSPEDRRCFVGAVSAVFALGASRTSGLGAVRMRLVESATAVESARPSVASRIEALESSRVRLVLEARDPLCLGDRLRSNFIETRDFVPAPTLRGAVVNAALRQRGLEHDPFEEAWFQRLLVDPETCLRFGDALPIAEDSGHADPRAAPLTARACKEHGIAHGVYDVLIREWLRALVAEQGHFHAPVDHCPRCGHARRTTAVVGLLDSIEPERRVVSRVALDRRYARAAEGQFFSMEVLEKGSRFAVTLEGVNAEGRRLLADAARHGLRLGHGRSRGYGRIAIIEAEAEAADSPETRVRTFDREIRHRLDLLSRAPVEPRTAAPGFDTPSAGTFFAIGLRSELALGEGRPHRAENSLVEVLDLPGHTRVLWGAVRMGQRGGWDARARRPKPVRPVLAAGSVLLLHSDAPPDALLDRLDALERRGAGDVREEGYGWVHVSDPIHLSRFTENR